VADRTVWGIVNTWQLERFREEYHTHCKALYKCPVYCLLARWPWLVTVASFLPGYSDGYVGLPCTRKGIQLESFDCFGKALVLQKVMWTRVNINMLAYDSISAFSRQHARSDDYVMLALLSQCVSKQCPFCHEPRWGCTLVQPGEYNQTVHVRPF